MYQIVNKQQLIQLLNGNDESEILTILVGEDVEVSEAEEIVSYVEEHFPDIEVELHEGLQPVYAYLLAVE